MWLKWKVVALFIVTLWQSELASACKREPTHLAHGSKSPGDNGYHIYMSDVQQGYQPGKIYNGEKFN